MIISGCNLYPHTYQKDSTPQTIQSSKNLSWEVKILSWKILSWNSVTWWIILSWWSQSVKVSIYQKKQEDKVRSQIDKKISRKDKPKNTNLTNLQRKILFEWWTEAAFNNIYRNNHKEGIYVDIEDWTPLFSSTNKYDSGTGWPTFTKTIQESYVSYQADNSEEIQRTEVRSKNWKKHFWHVFDDGPVSAGGKRYCINSAALRFVELSNMKNQWYEEYLYLFK